MARYKVLFISNKEQLILVKRQNKGGKRQFIEGWA